MIAQTSVTWAQGRHSAEEFSVGHSPTSSQQWPPHKCPFSDVQCRSKGDLCKQPLNSFAVPALSQCSGVMHMDGRWPSPEACMDQHQTMRPPGSLQGFPQEGEMKSLGFWGKLTCQELHRAQLSVRGLPSILREMRRQWFIVLQLFLSDWPPCLRGQVHRAWSAGTGYWGGDVATAQNSEERSAHESWNMGGEGHWNGKCFCACGKGSLGEAGEMMRCVHLWMWKSMCWCPRTARPSEGAAQSPARDYMGSFLLVLPALLWG